MKVSINPDPPVVERDGIRSGAIERSSAPLNGENPDLQRPYGVIFTGRRDVESNNIIATPDDFNPEQLLGAIVENTDLPESDQERFFTVLGGYFFEKRSSRAHTTRVFGIAADNKHGFGIEENGSVILADHWVLSDLSGSEATRMMDEREIGDERGWTLIVDEVRERSKYPPSNEAMGILADCVSNLVMQVEKLDESNESITVSCNLSHEGIGPDECTWVFERDQDPIVTTDLFVQHTYSKGQVERTATIEVFTAGPGQCSDQCDFEVLIPAAARPNQEDGDCVIVIKELPDPITVNVNVLTEQPCPVVLSFDDEPLGIRLNTSPKQPIHVDMPIDLQVKEPIPVCITLCEPICTDSSYRIDVSLFGIPLPSIRVGGDTDFFNC